MAERRTAQAPTDTPHSEGAARAALLAPYQLLRLVRDYAIVVSFFVLFLVLTFTSDVFLTSTNLLNLLEQNAPLGIIALALTVVLITGEFDLSVGAIASLTGVLAATWASHLGVWPAFIVAVTCAGAIGVINGLLVAYARINSFVSTLATGLIIAGVGLAITRGFLRTVSNISFTDLGLNEFLGVKYSIWMFAFAAVLTGVVLAGTKYGRWLYAVGEMPRLPGSPVSDLGWSGSLPSQSAGLLQALPGQSSRPEPVKDRPRTASTSPYSPSRRWWSAGRVS